MAFRTSSRLKGDGVRARGLASAHAKQLTLRVRLCMWRWAQMLDQLKGSFQLGDGSQVRVFSLAPAPVWLLLQAASGRPPSAVDARHTAMALTAMVWSPACCQHCQVQPEGNLQR